MTGRPYFVVTDTPGWTTNTYDALGRITLSTFPDLCTLATSYCGLVVSTTNADGHINTKVSNVQVYDGYGELNIQTDANSQVTNLSYDDLGRVVVRNAGGYRSAYVYDTASGMGVGELASATVGSGTGFIKTYAYDSLGRPSSVTLTEDGAAGVYSYAYDANSRLQTLTYPSGFVAANAYSPSGNLYRITDNGTGGVLWTAATRDAELHPLTQTQGSGAGAFTTTQALDPNTGLVQSILAGAGDSLSNQSFVFDPLGNLTSRTWLNGSTVTKENACYDARNRVTSTLITSGTACTGTGALTVAYDALGNITRKSDICNTANCYAYGGAAAGPHALSSIVGTYNGVANPSFAYDANGFMTSGGGRTVTATPFDMAATITDGANTAAFAYDADHARYRMVTTGVNAATTYYLNDPTTGAMEEEMVSGGATSWNDYIFAEGKLAAERFCAGAAACSTGATFDYFVLDQLGSISVVVNGAGAILNQLSYDAWGKRRNPDGTAIDCTAGGAPPDGVSRGFTGHEMLDGLCLVNMNARVYDPALGRFMAADPTVGDYTSAQEINRYSYVVNNPLSLTDPSGLCFLGCFWDSGIFRDILGIAAAFAFNYEILPAIEFGPVGTLGLSSVNQLVVVNAGISGGISGLISTGTLKGAALAALQGGLFAEAGNLLQPLKGTEAFAGGAAYAPAAFISHGLIGGLTSIGAGGKFAAGFLAAGLATFAPQPGPLRPWDDTFDKVVIAASLGGAGSVLGRGKFANGAVAGAFGYLFKDLTHAWAGTQATYALGRWLIGRDGAGSWLVDSGSFLDILLDGRADLIHVSDMETFEIKTVGCLANLSCASAAETQLARYIQSSGGVLSVGNDLTVFRTSQSILASGTVFDVDTRYLFGPSAYPGLIGYTILDADSILSQIRDAFRARSPGPTPWLLPSIPILAY